MTRTRRGFADGADTRQTDYTYDKLDRQTTITEYDKVEQLHRLARCSARRSARSSTTTRSATRRASPMASTARAGRRRLRRRQSGTRASAGRHLQLRRARPPGEHRPMASATPSPTRTTATATASARRPASERPMRGPCASSTTTPIGSSAARPATAAWSSSSYDEAGNQIAQGDAAKRRRGRQRRQCAGVVDADLRLRRQRPRDRGDRCARRGHRARARRLRQRGRDAARRRHRRRARV